MRTSPLETLLMSHIFHVQLSKDICEVFGSQKASISYHPDSKVFYAPVPGISIRSIKQGGDEYEVSPQYYWLMHFANTPWNVLGLNISSSFQLQDDPYWNDAEDDIAFKFEGVDDEEDETMFGEKVL